MPDTSLSIRPMEWSPLKDIDEVAPIGADDHDCLKELYAVLKKHGREERFGVTLLHRHFEMSDDEVLLESTDHASRTLMMRVAKKDAEQVSRSIQTSWMLKEDASNEVMTACYVSCERDVHGNHSRFHNREG